MEWDSWRRTICKGCGNPMAECVDDGDEAVEYEGFALVCWSCRARDVERNKWMASDGADLTGVSFGSRPVEGGDDG